MSGWIVHADILPGIIGSTL